MIKKLHIAASEDTPEIILDQENNVFEITGRSLPENVNNIFLPVFEWLKIYFNDPLQETVFSIKLEYLNSKILVCLVNRLCETKFSLFSDNKTMCLLPRSFQCIWEYACFLR